MQNHPKIKKIIEVLNQEEKNRREKEKENRNEKLSLRRSAERFEKESIDSDSGTYSTLQRSLTIESDKNPGMVGHLERSKTLMKNPAIRNPKLRS